MANCKSAKKRIITNAKRQERNSAYKSKLKTIVKKLSTDIEEKSKDREANLKETITYIDKLVSKGILQRNSAARKKSKLTLAYNKSV